MSFNAKERAHLQLLRRRLDYLRDGGATYPSGEVYALSWALGVLEESEIKLRIERLERTQRVMASRLGNLEKFVEDFEEVEE